MKKKRIILLSVLPVLALYIFFSSALIVKPETVVIVNELIIGKDNVKLTSRPLINNSERARLIFKQPVIPGTGIGYIEEIYTNETPYNFKTSFALYTLDQLTGNEEDKNKVRAYTITGTIGEILDWDTFLKKLNVDEFNSSRSPYMKKYSSRVQILADQLKYLLRTSNPEQYYPYGAGSEEAAMNLGQKINYLNQELVNRRNFIISLKDRYNFTEAELYRGYLISNTPWYWVLGIDKYEQLINQAKSLREYEQSVYSEQISRKGNAEKYIANEEYLNLINMMGRVNYYENNLIENEQKLINLNNYIEQMSKELDPSDLEMAYSVTKGFEKYLEISNVKLVDIEQEYLTPVMSDYINESLYPQLLDTINYRKLILNIEYLDVYRNQILQTYDFNESEYEEVEKIYNFLIGQYGELLEKENWENYMDSVEKEFNDFVLNHPDLPVPEDKIQILANYKLYDYYLRNIEPSLKKKSIDENHHLFPIIKNLSSYGDLFLADKKTVETMISSWLQNEDTSFLKAAGSIITYNWQLERIRGSMSNLQKFKNRELDPFILYESKNYNIEESETLWNAAINDVLNGKNLSLERPYIFHKVEKEETLNSIADLYHVEPFDIFYENRFDLQFQDPALRYRLDNQMSYNDLGYLSELNGKKNLKRNQEIYIEGEKKYTEEWTELNEYKKERREFFTEQYVYRNIEKMLPSAFYDFIDTTDYISNFERDYGVEFKDLRFFIENRNIFSNPRTGEVDNDFIDLYYQKTLR